MESFGVQRARALGQILRNHWGLLCVLLLWSYLFTYSASLKNPNERTRVLQARAIVEYGQLHIGETRPRRRGKFVAHDLYGARYKGVNDVGLICEKEDKAPPNCAGKLYPAKAPGTSFMGAPVLFVASLLGMVPEGKKGEINATWILRYGGVAFPMLLALWLFSLWLIKMGVPVEVRQILVLATGLGTGLFPYSIMFVGHATAGAAIFASCWFLSRAHQKNQGALLWGGVAGFFAAAAVFLEYHAAIATLCIAAWALVRFRQGRALVGFAAGSFPGLCLFMLFHNHVFGHPLRTGHAFLFTKHNRVHQAKGFLGLEGPGLESLGTHLFDTYMGLIPLMPWLFLGAVLGLREMWRSERNPALKDMNRTLVSVCLVYLLFAASLGPFRAMNGWSIGPRYLVPSMMAMAAVASIGWWSCLRDGRYRLFALCSALAAVSLVVVGTLTLAFPQPPSSVRSPFGELALPLLMEGWAVRNLGHYAGLGFGSIVLFVLALAAAAGVLLRGVEPAWQSASLRWQGRLISASVFCIWLWTLAAFSPTDSQKLLKAHQFVRDRVEGVSPVKAPLPGQ